MELRRLRESARVVEASAPSAPPATASTCSQAAVLRALQGRTSRTLLHATLLAWRAHCDQCAMMRNMHKALMRPQRLQQQQQQQQQTQQAPRPPSPPPPVAPKVVSTNPFDFPPSSFPSPPICSPFVHASPATQQTSPTHDRHALPRLRWRFALLRVLRARHAAAPRTIVVRQTRLPPPPAHGACIAASTSAGEKRSIGIPFDEQPTGQSQASRGVSNAAAATSAPLGTPPPPLPQRLLAWLAPDDPSTSDDSTPAAPLGGAAGANDAAALLVRVQHLSTENRYLRERVRMVESQMQPLLSELSEKVRANKLVPKTRLSFSRCSPFFPCLICGAARAPTLCVRANAPGSNKGGRDRGGVGGYRSTSCAGALPRRRRRRRGRFCGGRLRSRRRGRRGSI